MSDFILEIYGEEIPSSAQSLIENQFVKLFSQILEDNEIKYKDSPQRIIIHRLLVKLKIDDVVSAIPVHLVGGMWGTISVAIFGDFEMMGLDRTRLEQLTIQIIGSFSIGGFCFFVWYRFNCDCASDVS